MIFGQITTGFYTNKPFWKFRLRFEKVARNRPRWIENCEFDHFRWFNVLTVDKKRAAYYSALIERQAICYDLVKGGIYILFIKPPYSAPHGENSF